MQHLGIMLGPLYAFSNSLYKSSLRFYFLVWRIRIWWESDASTRWSFAVRFEGDYNEKSIQELLVGLKDRDSFRFPVSIDYSKGLEAQVEIDETLIVRLSYAPPEPPHWTTGVVTVTSKTLEVAYGQARRKLNEQIIPVIQELERILRPERAFYELNVAFIKGNPFFALYIAHLKPDQIGDFRVRLQMGKYPGATARDTVEISRDSMQVVAISTNSFKEIAASFIMLSPDLRSLRGESG